MVIENSPVLKPRWYLVKRTLLNKFPLYTATDFFKKNWVIVIFLEKVFKSFTVFNLDGKKILKKFELVWLNFQLDLAICILFISLSNPTSYRHFRLVSFCSTSMRMIYWIPSYTPYLWFVTENTVVTCTRNPIKLKIHLSVST